MKFRIYVIALALLPAIYIGLMLIVKQPIEWSLIGVMAAIVIPLILFRKKIGAIEHQFNAMSDKEKVQVVAKTAAKVVRKTSGQE